uniref:G-protein coupled receptors family 1 profile domain-containing protein n=1 Tax=Meloidogyne incognita TaxID=6306 RepID=A0A914LZN9_MELIC
MVYFIPLFVILFCYGSILVSISLKSRDTKVASEPEQPPKEQRNITKLALLRGHEIHQQLAAGRSARWRRTSSLATVPASLYFSKTQPKYYGTTGGENNNNINWSKRPSVAATNMSNGLRRTGGGDSYERAKSKTLKMTLVLVLAFLLCWTPYTIAMFIHFLRVQTEARPISPLLSKFLYAFAVFNSAISPYLYGYFSFNIRDECRQLRYLVFRSAPARCLLRHGDSTEESISHSRSPFGPLAPGQRDSRRRAMIRRESRVREGLMMCEEGQQQKRQSVSAAKDSSRVVTGQQRAPKLGDTSRTFSLNTTATTLISNSSFSNGQCSAITRRRPRLNDDRDLMEVDSKEEEEDQEELDEVGERRNSLLICNENNE